MLHTFLSRNAALCLLILAFTFTFAPAQTSTDTISKTSTENVSGNTSAQADETTNYAPKRQLGFWGGTYTFHRDLAGASARAGFGIFSVRYSRTINKSPRVRLKYTVDFAPLVIINFRNERLVQENPRVLDVERDTAFGIGASPFGLQANFRNGKKVQPFVGGSLGVILFNKPVPDRRSPLEPNAIGKKLNFTGDVGGGVEIGLKNNKSFLIGYKYHHISNAYRGGINVGYNINLVWAGLNFSR
ncbi:MAG: acyloxyacyl hydrolase [Pyrinomonadaceae bacterium]